MATTPKSNKSSTDLTDEQINAIGKEKLLQLVTPPSPEMEVGGSNIQLTQDELDEAAGVIEGLEVDLSESTDGGPVDGEGQLDGDIKEEETKELADDSPEMVEALRQLEIAKEAAKSTIEEAQKRLEAEAKVISDATASAKEAELKVKRTKTQPEHDRIQRIIDRKSPRIAELELELKTALEDYQAKIKDSVEELEDLQQEVKSLTESDPWFVKVQPEVTVMTRQSRVRNPHNGESTQGGSTRKSAGASQAAMDGISEWIYSVISEEQKDTKSSQAAQRGAEIRKVATKDGVEWRLYVHATQTHGRHRWDSTHTLIKAILGETYSPGLNYPVRVINPALTATDDKTTLIKQPESTDKSSESTTSEPATTA